jgi:tRNA dimethylallyltransferase
VNADAVLIAGPTASGKSAAALALAQRIAGALVNTDSMQVYSEARILTARPDATALAHAPHFLYGHVSVHHAYSAARFRGDAEEVFRQVRALGRLPIFVGGTGLYFAALTDGLAEIPPVPAAVREQVRSRGKQQGTAAIHAELAVRDPATAARLRPTDTQRVLRAFEVLEATGCSLSEWQRNSGAAPLAGLRLARFVLSPPRTELHARIAARFETMLAGGALEEAAALHALDPALPAARILGLRELWRLLDGSATRQETITAVIAATRQYAKRQLTWFRHRMADWTWIEETGRDAIVGRMMGAICTPTSQ